MKTATKLTLTGIAASAMLVAPLAASAATSNQLPNDANGIKAQADAKIGQRVDQLNKLIGKINANQYDGSDRASLVGQDQNELQGLEQLKGKIDNESDIDQLKADYKKIFTDYRVYALVTPKDHLVVGSDTALSVGDRLSETADRLQERINDAQSHGKDVTALQATLNDMRAKIADARTNASSAHGASVGLTPADWNANHDILSSPKSEMQTARTDLKSARADAQQIRAGLK